jgi:glycosyltransferase involved in cell wall biosynthesis
LLTTDPLANEMTILADPPAHVDRLVVHQFDPGRPSPGGIDSCLRGISRYLPPGIDVAVVGVDTRGNGQPHSVAGGADRAGRKLGQWEQHSLDGGRRFWFLPVVALDPADQTRRLPHSLRLMAGLLRHLRRLPSADLIQVHRMDSAVALRVILRRKPQVYFIHTQENGLTGDTSDSFWRWAAAAHRLLEQWVVTRAKAVVVFNEAYSHRVKQWNSRAVFSPTWFDPALIKAESATRDPHKILWVGRFEVPKDPQLAVDAVAHLISHDPSSPWSLDMVGSGTQFENVRKRVAGLPQVVADRIRLLGRVTPEGVASRMAASGLFLMTSHGGYEGYPRVLVESMASGLPAVVTLGSDTGGLVVDGETGFACGREPQDLAARLKNALPIDRNKVRSAVAALDAPSLVERIFALDEKVLHQVAV